MHRIARQTVGLKMQLGLVQMLINVLKVSLNLILVFFMAKSNIKQHSK